MKCIVKVANMTKLGERTRRQAAEIMHNIAKKEISARKDPMGLAASILYLSSIKTGEIITQSDFARAA
jgi:transcription initiation factor TFIIB